MVRCSLLRSVIPVLVLVLSVLPGPGLAAELGCIVNLGAAEVGGTIAGVDNGYFGRFSVDAHGSACRSLDSGLYELHLEYGRLKRTLRFQVFNKPIQTEFSFKRPSSMLEDELYWLVKLE